MAQGRHRKKKGWIARLWPIAITYFASLAGRLTADWLARAAGWLR